MQKILEKIDLLLERSEKWIDKMIVCFCILVFLILAYKVFEGIKQNNFDHLFNQKNIISFAYSKAEQELTKTDLE